MTAQASKAPNYDPSFVDNLTQNVAVQFLDRVAASGSKEAFRYPRGEAWESVTWKQVGLELREQELGWSAASPLRYGA